MMNLCKWSALKFLNYRHLNSRFGNILNTSRKCSGKIGSPVRNVTESHEFYNKVLSTPLSSPIAGFPAFQYQSFDRNRTATRITTLKNGLRVASEEQFGNFCTVGVTCDSGSRYEAAFPCGITHFLEKLAFQSTADFESSDAVSQLLALHSGIFDCQSSREVLIYAISCHKRGIEDALHILSEVILRPRFTDEEIFMARQIILNEHEQMKIHPEPEKVLINDGIHAAAYGDNTLGLPKTCPTSNIDMIDKSLLHTFMKAYHSPERMVVAGVGIDHDLLVDMVRRHFETKEPSWVNAKPMPVDKSIAQYTGGFKGLDHDLSVLCYGPNPLPEMAHLVIGLESCSHFDPDFIPACVLNLLMGGGGSFSAGGPGKGMYTRLYLRVLNVHHWIHNATSYNYAYKDTGIFFIHASSAPEDLQKLAAVVCRELTDMCGSISKDEFDRAKSQLQSMLLMNLESRPVVFEDISRQILAYGKRKLADELYNDIGRVTMQDLNRVAVRMLTCRPSVAMMGNLNHAPKRDDIRKALATSSPSNAFSRRFKLFGSS